MRKILTLLGVFLPLVTVAPGSAQEVEITAPPPARERLVVPPGDHEQATRPSDAEYYPRTPGVRHDPAFIRPLSRKTQTRRVGAAGWTSPASPVGPSQLHGETTGWLAFGVAVEWGGPRTVKPAARPRKR
jgi:hypothetical protein